ncbi:hypothetical protein PB2503_12839 [Parvularcula bermudensis HTCC2503]|uniref:Lipoprotein n=1 Tax=Parvularcula bermudensis (strain ATCC BAA-594 / HTCC2503 / KCTC 12087) TaxID=314260 RepID=E0TG34_PARBH|nr:YnbE family lipoprotein [Parvularcula bermudensis]ADM10605.1 hypothetical protein PB2503_12839 [Parvularcula bermudensis HTCC2503]
MSRMIPSPYRPLALAAALISALSACATVRVEAPDEPIEINLNIKIEQEVRVRLERDVEELIAQNPDLF